MQSNIDQIEIYNKRNRLSVIIDVEKISNNIFRTIENEIIDFRLTIGTEFETCINADGKHEIVRVIKRSDFITKRFILTSQFNFSEYRLLADEITKQGGFWQVDFGNIATVNLPKDCKLDLDEIFKAFDFSPEYIIDKEI